MLALIQPPHLSRRAGAGGGNDEFAHMDSIPFSATGTGQPLVCSLL